MLYSASTPQKQSLTLESLNKSIEEFNKCNVSMHRTMALSGIDIIPDSKLPPGYWCITCSPDVYVKIQIEIDKIIDKEL